MSSPALPCADACGANPASVRSQQAGTPDTVIAFKAAMRGGGNKASNLRLVCWGLTLGCLMVTLLASRSLFSTGEAVAHQIRQPRRGLQGSADPSTQPLSLGLPDASVDASHVLHCAAECMLACVLACLRRSAFIMRQA